VTNRADVAVRLLAIELLFGHQLALSVGASRRLRLALSPFLKQANSAL
jgi:hypothetical protein